MTQFEGYIDAGKHLSLLHSQLVESLPKPESEAREKFADLDPILSDITNELNNVPTANNQNSGQNTVSVKTLIYKYTFICFHQYLQNMISQK